MTLMNSVIAPITVGSHQVKAEFLNSTNLFCIEQEPTNSIM